MNLVYQTIRKRAERQQEENSAPHGEGVTEKKDKKILISKVNLMVS